MNTGHLFMSLAPLLFVFLGPFVMGITGYAGVKLANKWFGPISIRTLPPKD